MSIVEKEIVSLVKGDVAPFYHPKTSDITFGRVVRIISLNSFNGVHKKLYTMAIENPPKDQPKHVAITIDHVVHLEDLI